MLLHRQAFLTPRGGGKSDPEGGLPSPPASLRGADVRQVIMAITFLPGMDSCGLIGNEAVPC